MREDKVHALKSQLEHERALHLRQKLSDDETIQSLRCEVEVLREELGALTEHVDHRKSWE